MEQAITSFAKNPKGAPTDVKGIATKAMTKSEEAVLTPEQRKTVAEKGVNGLFRKNHIWFLESFAGRPFRQEYRRKMAAVVLGQPYGDVGVIVDAVSSLSKLAVSSLEEDPYGNVQRDVKAIILTLTSTITNLQKFRRDMGNHWTDVEKKQDSPEADAVLDKMKEGLGDLIVAFGDYNEVLKLSKGEMRLAREAAEKTESRPEMEQVG